jgi:hypothetical protein
LITSLTPFPFSLGDGRSNVTVTTLTGDDGTTAQPDFDSQRGDVWINRKEQVSSSGNTTDGDTHTGGNRAVLAALEPNRL